MNKIEELQEAINNLQKQLDEINKTQKRNIKYTVIIGNLLWQAERNEKYLSFKDAIKYAESCEDGWRLPTVAELVSIVDYRKQERMTVDLITYSENDFYMTSTEDINDEEAVWMVDFESGEITSVGKSGKAYVRLVKDLITT